MPPVDFPLTEPQEVGRWEFRPKPWHGPVSSAILLALAFQGLWPLVFVALVPWLRSLREATPRQAWNRGYAFGLLFSLSQLWWLGDLAYKWTGSLVLGILPWLLASLLSAVYYGLLGRLVRNAPWWAVPLVWAGMEFFRSYIPVLAFPWALLAEPLVGTPLRGLAWFGTIYLVSAGVVAVNVALASPTHRAARLGSIAGAALLLLAFWRIASSSGTDERVPPMVAAGQIGVDMAFEAQTAALRIGPAVEALSAEAHAKGVDLLVLPEGLGPAGRSIPPGTLFKIPDAPALVFGEQREGARAVYQSAFAHGAEGWSFADKTRLVIFGEFVPGRDYFPFLQNAFHLPGGDLSAGDKLSTLRAGGVTVGPLICFEALFPDLGLRQARAGAKTLAVMSIDDWFALPARERLANAARWRATEAGLPLVRAGSLGRSMVLDARGDVLDAVPFGGRRLAVAQPGPGRGPFPAVWLFPVVAVASLVGVPILKRRRARKGDAATL